MSGLELREKAEAKYLAPCPRCGRPGDHDCILLRSESKRPGFDAEKEFDRLRTRVRDVEDQMTELGRSFAHHHMVETQTTYTCRCGKVFWNLSSFNDHVAEETKV